MKNTKNEVGLSLDLTTEFENENVKPCVKTGRIKDCTCENVYVHMHEIDCYLKCKFIRYY